MLEKYKEPCPEALVESAQQNIKILEDNDFYNFKIRSRQIFLTVKAYRQLSKISNYPLHLGVTEAGGLFTGSIKSSIGRVAFNGRHWRHYKSFTIIRSC